MISAKLWCNAADEAMNGFANSISVTLHADGTTISVEDNGRGIPTDIHPKLGKSALEIILTTLHSGGKFDNKAYSSSGGLHGVGSSAVNALSISLEARVRRDGKEWKQEYRKGRPKEDVVEVGPARGSGTRITFTPDPEIFEETCLDSERILARMKIKSFLHKGVKFIYKDQVAGKRHELKHDGGVLDFLAAVVKESNDQTVLARAEMLGRRQKTTPWCVSSVTRFSSLRCPGRTKRRA